MATATASNSAPTATAAAWAADAAWDRLPAEDAHHSDKTTRFMIPQ